MYMMERTFLSFHIAQLVIRSYRFSSAENSLNA